MYTKSAMGREFKVGINNQGKRVYINPDSNIVWHTGKVEIDELRAVLFLEGLALQKEADKDD